MSRLNLDTIKGRIAEALVEDIFHCAGFRVARLGRESDVQRLLKEGDDEYAPDFLIWKPVEGTPGAFRLLNVEVKYRADLANFFRYGGVEKLTEAKLRWADLYFIFVTDHPVAGRSCFQALCLSDYTPGNEPATTDLHRVSALDIYRSTVEEHERLARSLFAALGSHTDPACMRRAPAVATGQRGVATGGVR